MDQFPYVWFTLTLNVKEAHCVFNTVMMIKSLDIREPNSMTSSQSTPAWKRQAIVDGLRLSQCVLTDSWFMYIFFSHKAFNAIRSSQPTSRSLWSLFPPNWLSYLGFSQKQTLRPGLSERILFRSTCYTSSKGNI